jgi:two-component system, NtrC family, sensor kinase
VAFDEDSTEPTTAPPAATAFPEEPGAATLDAISQEAQRALLERPSLSIRKRLGLGLLLWLVLSVGATLASLVLLGRVQAKLRIVGAVDRYAFEIQQARRFEKNFFLYSTNLDDALAQARAAQDILESEGGAISAVVGSASVEAMRARVVRYESLLSGLDGATPTADTALLRAVEAELRVQGAEMVDEAANLAAQERTSVSAMLRTSERIAAGFLVGLLVLVVSLGVFTARQILAPLNRIMLATRRIAGGDLTPITPRRRYHDELSELAAGINHMLHELVRRQEILVQAHKLQAIGTLTAGVAHELNNPINNLMLTAAALQEDYHELDDDQRLEMASDLVRESERARDIVRNLLDFAREREVDLEPLDVEQIVTETLQLAANQVKLSRVKVRGEVEESLPPVHGDRHQLTQVFLNLVLNALDAMPAGGTLTISLEKSDDRESVNIRLMDTGCGIAEQDLSRIFQPFFSTKKHAKGTGLGLSVSLGIIKQHGGDIRVESQVGVGTTFTVSLPIAKVPAPARMEAVGV